MKPATFHAPSLLVGIACAAGAILLMSQSVAPTFPTARVEVGPHPRDMVQIREGAPYTVPNGRIFVLTALGARFYSQHTNLMVNGAPVLAANTSAGVAFLGMQTVPSGYSVPAGSVIEVEDNAGGTTEGMAWGYLADR